MNAANCGFKHAASHMAKNYVHDAEENSFKTRDTFRNSQRSQKGFLKTPCSKEEHYNFSLREKCQAS